MKQRYYVSWLRPSHARQIARLERKVYPRSYRAGHASILEDLSLAERQRTNLSMGVFLGRHLVGFLLVFYETDRRKICDYLDIVPPASVDLSGPGIYLNDFVVHPKHRGAGAMLAVRLANAVRTSVDFRDCPIDTFSTATMAEVWRRNARFLARVSMQLVQEQQLDIAAGGEPLIWLSFRRTSRTPKPLPLASVLKRQQQIAGDGGPVTLGIVDCMPDWMRLEAGWNDLLSKSPNSTVFQTYEYLTTWWGLLGLRNELFIVVALRAGRPVAIAPMQISPKPWLGQVQRCLGFIGHPSEVDRNTVLLDPGENPVAVLLADYLIECRDLWDCCALYEQPPNSAFLSSFAARLRERGYIVSAASGPPCASTDIDGTWDRFLAGRPKSFRKSVRRKLGNVAENRVESVVDEAMTIEALDRYQELEGRGWKPQAGLGVGKSTSHWWFYRQIVRQFGGMKAVKFRFLLASGALLAATFGLEWRRTFYSLHIAHDPAHEDISPGFVLTALELKAAFDSREFDTFDFLGGFMANKRGWATAIAETTALFAHEPTLRGGAFHMLYFRVRPPLRRALIRLRLLDYANALKTSVRRFIARLRA